jgi:hypothetical protein
VTCGPIPNPQAGDYWMDRSSPTRTHLEKRLPQG